MLRLRFTQRVQYSFCRQLVCAMCKFRLLLLVIPVPPSLPRLFRRRVCFGRCSGFKTAWECRRPPRGSSSGGALFRSCCRVALVVVVVLAINGIFSLRLLGCFAFENGAKCTFDPLLYCRVVIISLSCVWFGVVTGTDSRWCRSCPSLPMTLVTLVTLGFSQGAPPVLVVLSVGPVVIRTTFENLSLSGRKPQEQNTALITPS